MRQQQTEYDLSSRVKDRNFTKIKYRLVWDIDYVYVIMDCMFYLYIITNGLFYLRVIMDGYFTSTKCVKNFGD